MKLQQGQMGAQPPQGSGIGAAGQKANDDQLIRLNLQRALQLHWRLAAGFAVAGLLLAVVYAVMLWPVYTAKSQIYVQPVQPKVMTGGNDQNVSVNAAAYDAYIQQQVQGASSPAVLINALSKLGPDAWRQVNESEPVAADRLGHAVEATRVGTSYEVAITARANNPGLAANIANAVANSIAEKASGEGNAGDVQRIAVLKEERERIQNELKSDYAEQDDLNKQLGMASVGTAPPDMIDDQIARTREELIKAQTDHDQSEAKFSAMKAGQGTTSAAIDAEADDIINTDAGLSSMKTSLNQRRAVLITQMANLTPQNPGYKLAADELTKINSSLDAMMKELRSSAAARIQQKLRTDLERTAHVEGQLNGQLRLLAHAAAGATPKLQRVNDLANDIVRLRNRFSAVDEQLHNLMLEDSAPGAVHVSVAAVPPLHPSLGKILKGALPLALGGIILGLLCAIVANKLDQRVYIADDLEHALGFAPMAVLPDFSEVSEAVASEHVMRLAAAIEHAGRKAELQTCIFTGTSGGTGVTTIARRVKDILAVIGRPAVLMDAAGNVHHDQHKADGSKALTKQPPVRSELAPDTLILVDTAPLMLSAETEYLARSVDGAIVVVESGVTTRAQLQAAINALQRLDVSAVGFVLNKVGSVKADPAFRLSLRDMEKHLLNQGTTSSMWPVMWRGFIHEPPPASAQTSVGNALPATAAPAQKAAEQADPMAGFVLRRPAIAQTPAPKPAPPDEGAMPRSLTASAQQSEHEPPSCAAQSSQSEYPATAPRRIETPKLPDWFLGSGSSGSGSFMRLAASEASTSVQESAPSEAESRVERLRGLFSNVGLSDLRRSHTQHTEVPLHSVAEPAQPAPPLAPNHPVTNSADPTVGIPLTRGPVVETPTAKPPEKRVEAAPEILSPKDFAPASTQNRKPNPPRFSSWNDDEIQTLPSRRGQYGAR
jgi:polysaccharide biosynthesis transport protein